MLYGIRLAFVRIVLLALKIEASKYVPENWGRGGYESARGSQNANLWSERRVGRRKASCLCIHSIRRTCSNAKTKRRTPAFSVLMARLHLQVRGLIRACSWKGEVWSRVTKLTRRRRNISVPYWSSFFVTDEKLKLWSSCVSSIQFSSLRSLTAIFCGFAWTLETHETLKRDRKKRSRGIPTNRSTPRPF